MGKYHQLALDFLNLSELARDDADRMALLRTAEKYARIARDADAPADSETKRATRAA